jgi:hypothetical protein
VDLPHVLINSDLPVGNISANTARFYQQRGRRIHHNAIVPLRRVCSTKDTITLLGKTKACRDNRLPPLLDGTPPVAPTSTFCFRRSYGVLVDWGGVLFPQLPHVCMRR